MNELSWQPLIDAAAALLGSYTVLVMLVLTWFCLLFGRDRVGKWLEALGWEGVRETFAGFGNSPSSLIRAKREAEDAEPKAGNVSTLVRP